MDGEGPRIITPRKNTFRLKFVEYYCRRFYEYIAHNKCKYAHVNSGPGKLLFDVDRATDDLRPRNPARQPRRTAAARD